MFIQLGSVSADVKTSSLSDSYTQQLLCHASFLKGCHLCIHHQLTDEAQLQQTQGPWRSFSLWLHSKAHTGRQELKIVLRSASLKKKKKLFIYLAAPGLSCSMWDLVP